MIGRRLAIAVAVAVAAGTGVAIARTPTPSDVARGVRTPEDEKIDGRLRALIAPGAPVSRRPELTMRPLPALAGSRAHVFVRLASVDAASIAAVAAAGLAVERIGDRRNVVRGWVAPADVHRLAALGVVRTITPVRAGHVRAGSVTSEGDADAKGPQARGAAGVDGSGIVVGVISDGIDHIVSAISTDDAPAGTGVPAGSGCVAGSGDEGTALIEIVHDVAPGATIRFSSGVGDPMSFVDSMHCLANAGARVIVDDVGFYDEPFFEDGTVAQEAQLLVQSGVTVVSAAGNDGEDHYGGLFDESRDATSGEIYHDFGAKSGHAGDTFDRVDLPPGSDIECFLQWDDPFGASSNDYDLELWDMDQNPPALVQASGNVQTGTQDPFEAVGALLNSGNTTAHLAVRVRQVHGVTRVLGLYCLGATNMQYVVAAGSLFGHPGVNEVVAVGALDAKAPSLMQLEPFSSQGPVTLYVPGTVVRTKPDLAGFDDVTTTVCPSASACFSPFFGTSAAAPHVAGVAALLLASDACRTPAEVMQALRQGADDVFPTGVDDESGAGRLDAVGALAVPGPCDDGDPCTADSCGPGQVCQHTQLDDGTPCPDANLCNGTETCEGGTCTPSGTPLDCDDGDACTEDACDPASGCVHVFACDDHNACTTDSCDQATGCQHVPVADGSSCADDDACNGAETCESGACTAGAPLTCTDGPACSTSSCDRVQGCSYGPAEGFPGLTCMCGEGLAPASCADATLPPSVAKRYGHACELVAKAAILTNARQARRLAVRTVTALAAADKTVERLTKKSRIPSDCGQALAATLQDTLARARRVRDTL